MPAMTAHAYACETRIAQCNVQSRTQRAQDTPHTHPADGAHPEPDWGRRLDTQVERMRTPEDEPGSQTWAACMIPLHYVR